MSDISGAPATAPTTPATAPEAPSQSAATPEPKSPQKASKASRADFVKNLNASLGLGKAAPDQPIPAADVSATETAETAEGTASTEPVNTPETAETAEGTASTEPVNTPETAEETPAPEPETPKEEKVHAHKLAALQLEAQRAKSESLKAKESLKAEQARVQELTKQLESLKDVKAALKHAGTDPRAFAQELIDGKVNIDDLPKAAERDPEVQALLDEAKAAREKSAKEAERAQAQAVRAENVKLVQSAVDAQGFADAFPLVAAMPDAAATMLTWIEAGIEQTGSEPDFETVAKMVQDVTLKETLAYLKHPGARKTLLADPDLAKILKAVEEVAPAVAAPAKAVAGAAPAKPVASAAKPVASAVKPAAEPAASEEGKNESPLVTEAKRRAKTLTKAMGNSVPSRAERASSSADLAAQLNRDVLGKG